MILDMRKQDMNLIMDENKQQTVRELFNKYLEIVESTSYRISYYHKCLLISELEEMMEEKDKEIERLKSEFNKLKDWGYLKVINKA